MLNLEWLKSLRHIFKLDPNKPITEEQIKEISFSGTDAIIVGGTLDVSFADTELLLQLLKKYKRTILIQEVSNIDAIVPGFDYYFIPLVLNAQDPNWILNMHHYAIKMYGNLIDWNQIIVEGYIVLNKNSSVAMLTKSKTDIVVEDIIAYGRMAEQMLKLPIIYVEYSGTYGDENNIKELARVIEESRLFYGGGIKSKEEAQKMLDYASTIIVGNLLYEDFPLALETVIK